MLVELVEYGSERQDEYCDYVAIKIGDMDLRLSLTHDDLLIIREASGKHLIIHPDGSNAIHVGVMA